MDELHIHKHSTYVQSIRGGDGGYFAVCASCGWQGGDRPEKVNAQADGESHANGTGYRWDDLRKRFVVPESTA